MASIPSDYDCLITALEIRFAPPNQTELYRVQLKDRRQKITYAMAMYTPFLKITFYHLCKLHCIRREDLSLLLLLK